jgi:hypothetical protein
VRTRRSRVSGHIDGEGTAVDVIERCPNQPWIAPASLCRRFSHLQKSPRRDHNGWLGREDSNLGIAVGHAGRRKGVAHMLTAATTTAGNVGGSPTPGNHIAETGLAGWGGRIRTSAFLKSIYLNYRTNLRSFRKWAIRDSLRSYERQPGPKAAIDGPQHRQAKQSLAKVSGAAAKRIVPS